jgi:hypothetical protein
MMIISAKQDKNSGFNSLKNKLSDFNRNSFREIRLSVTQSALGDKDMFLVRGFKNEAEADRYYQAIKNDASVKIAVSQTKSNQYIISNGNFRLLFKSKDEQEYIKFFKSDYNQ